MTERQQTHAAALELLRGHQPVPQRDGYAKHPCDERFGGMAVMALSAVAFLVVGALLDQVTLPW